MTQVGRSPCADPVIETYTSLSKTQTLHDLTTRSGAQRPSRSAAIHGVGEG